MTAKHLNIDMEIKDLKLMEGEHMKPEFLKINPQHCIPTLDDNGFVLWESRAIITYLVNEYGENSSLYPKDPKKRAIVDRMLYYDMGTFGKALMDWVYPQILNRPVTDLDEREKKMKDTLKQFDTLMMDKKYVAGENLTVADLSLLSTITSLMALDFDYSSHANVTKWINRLQAELPYYDNYVTQAVAQLKAWINKGKA
jgi:glutathione S-transferase